MKRAATLTALALAAALAVWLIWRHLTRTTPLPPSPRTIQEVMAAISPEARRALRPLFRQADAVFPPSEITLVALKEERLLKLYAPDAGGRLRYVTQWPILAASGTSGRKSREGDGQVPEGFYGIQSLNPNSRFHLSLRVNYPNTEDVARGRREGRDVASLGGDIMIHGGAVSTGCLAVGDAVAEELFFLVAGSDLGRSRLLIVPWDLRRSDRVPEADELYGRLRAALRELPE